MAFTPGLERTLAVRVQSTGIGDLNSGLTGIIGNLGNLSRLALGASAALGALAAGGLAASIGAAERFNQQVRELTKVTDPLQAQVISEGMQRISESIPLATTELQTIATAAARFGITGSENIEQFTETVARMAFATDVSVEQAGQAFARLSVLTETPISNIENLGSSINTLGQTTATSAGEIVDGMLRSAASLSQLGVTNREIVGLQASLNAVSESSRRAGTRLRRVAQELVNPKRASDIASALGLTVEQFQAMIKEDPTDVIMMMARAMREGGETADALNRTFSTASRQALAGLAQNYEGVQQAISDSNSAFEEGTSLQREFEIEANSLRSEVQLLRNALFNTGEETGQVFIPALRDLVGFTTTGVQAFRDLNTASNGLAGALAGVGIAAAGTVASLRLLNVGSATPIGLAIGGVVALGAAWSANWAGIRQVTSNSVNDIQGTIIRLSKTLGILKEDVGDQRSEWGRLMSFLEKRVAVGLEVIAGGFNTILDAMGTVAKMSVQMQRGEMEEMLETREEFFDRVRGRQNRMRNVIQDIREGDAAFQASDSDVVPGTGEDREQQAKQEAKEVADAYKEAWEQGMGGIGATGGAGTGAGVVLSAEDRASLVRTVGEQTVMARRENDATEVAGLAGVSARVGKPDNTMFPQDITINGGINVETKDDSTSGEDILASINREIQSSNVVDTNGVLSE